MTFTFFLGEKKFRVVKRLVELKRGKKSGSKTIFTDGNRPSKSIMDQFQKYTFVVRIVSRLARRPLCGNQPDFWNLQIVQRVHNASRSFLISLFRFGGSTLSGPTRNIFMKNVGLALRRRSDVVYSSYMHSSPAYAIGRTKKRTLALLRNWLHLVEANGVLCILRTRLSVSASPSLITQFDSSKKWGMTPFHQTPCVCHEFTDPNIYKVENHVFMPLSKFLEHYVGPCPENWNMLARLPPDKEVVLKEFDRKQNVLVEKVQRKILRHPDWEKAILLPTPHLHLGAWNDWEFAKQTKGQHWWEFENLLGQLSIILVNFLVTPVDKGKGEGIVRCPLKAAEAARDVTQTYRRVSDEAYHELLSRMFTLLSDVPGLVFSRFLKKSHHAFGIMRLWVKQKCLVEPPTLWSEMKYRLLVPFSKHHYRHSLSYLARFCYFVAEKYKLGCGSMDPAEIFSRMCTFNEQLRREYFRTGQYPEIEFDIFDIGDFFSCMPRSFVMRVVTFWCRKILMDHPDTPFFCVAKNRNAQRLPRNSAHARWRNRMFRMKKKYFLSAQVTRHEIGMHVGLIPRLVEVDFACDIVWILGVPCCPDDGLNIGSPASATTASLVASTKEFFQILGLPLPDQVFVNTMMLNIR